MLARLLVGIGELDHLGVVVRPAEERDPGRQIVAGKSGRHHDRRHEHQECVDVRRALLVDERRVDAFLDQRRLMLDRFVNDRVEPVIAMTFSMLIISVSRARMVGELLARSNSAFDPAARGRCW